MKVAAVIPSAGSGTRMKSSLSKPFLPIGGKPLLCHTLSSFEESPVINEIVVVLSKEEREIAIAKVFGASTFKKVSSWVAGGAERIASVYNGLKAIDQNTDFVVIHDGCRPFVTFAMIAASVEAAKETGGSIAAIPLRDTLKRGSNGLIEATISREGLWQAQTPQTFRYQLIMEAYETAMNHGSFATDDASLMEQMGHSVKIFPGSLLNIKITVPEDLILAELILRHRKELNGLEGV